MGTSSVPMPRQKFASAQYIVVFRATDRLLGWSSLLIVSDDIRSSVSDPASRPAPLLIPVGCSCRFPRVPLVNLSLAYRRDVGSFSGSSASRKASQWKSRSSLAGLRARGRMLSGLVALDHRLPLLQTAFSPPSEPSDSVSSSTSTGTCRRLI